MVKFVFYDRSYMYIQSSILETNAIFMSIFIQIIEGSDTE